VRTGRHARASEHERHAHELLLQAVPVAEEAALEQLLRRGRPVKATTVVVEPEGGEPARSSPSQWSPLQTLAS
jgi:hypothetical protein